MLPATRRHKALFAAGLSNRHTLDRVVSIERLEPREGKLSGTAPRGPERVTARAYPVPLDTTRIYGIGTLHCFRAED